MDLGLRIPLALCHWYSLLCVLCTFVGIDRGAEARWLFIVKA